MAKKQEQQTAQKVFCKNCHWGGNIENYLIDCHNKQANPGGFKMGCWEKPCNYFKKK
jgi:hypothetical protein